MGKSRFDWRFEERGRCSHWSWLMAPPVVVKDGLLITFDLETLRKDFDGDGLTDIEEARLRTDPFNVDTDNGGISDKLNLNPRCNEPRTDQTIIFDVILNEGITMPFYDKEDPLVIPFGEIPETYYCTDATKTVMIVTDDPFSPYLSHRVLLVIR